MTTLIRLIVASGWVAVLLAGSWFAAVGVYLGIPPTPSFSASINDRFYHADPNCPHRKTGEPIAPFDDQAHAERFGTPCPHCVKGR